MSLLDQGWRSATPPMHTGQLTESDMHIPEPPIDIEDTQRWPVLPMAYYLLGNSRISLAAGSKWCKALELIGATRVDRLAYERADALRKGERDE